jgi:hypothetical protein
MASKYTCEKCHKFFDTEEDGLKHIFENESEGGVYTHFIAKGNNEE